MVIIIPMNEQWIRRLDYLAAFAQIGLAGLSMLCFNLSAARLWMAKATETMREHNGTT